MKTTKQPKVKSSKPENYIAFISACISFGLPMPICASNGGELIFAKVFGRDWRTDYLFTNGAAGMKLAVEIEGGTWNNGAHNRGSGFLKNIQKYNAYSLLGYTLLRFTAQQAKKEPMLCARWVKCVLEGVTDATLLEMSQAERLEGEKIRARAAAKKAAKSPPLQPIYFQKIAKKSAQNKSISKTTKGMSKHAKLWLDIQDKNKDL